MSRLPIPGSDQGTWGNILNDFLATAHNPDGSLKPGAIAVPDGSISTAKLADNAITNTKLDASTQTTLATVASKYTKPAGGVPATDLSTGVQASLSSADTALQVAPVTSVNTQTGAVSFTKADLGLTNVDNTSDANKPVSTAQATALSGKVDTTDSRLADARTPTAHTQAAATISDSTATGRSVVTATDASAARAAIGAGTSSLALGSTAGTALDAASASATYATVVPVVGATADGSADTTTELDAAIAEATSQATALGSPVAVYLPRGRYKRTTAINLDVSKVRLIGDRAIIEWPSAPAGGYALSVHSSANYTGVFRNWGYALDGVSLRGNLFTPLSGVGIRIGHATDTDSGNITLANGGVEGFATNVQYITNAWRITLREFSIRGNVSIAISAASSLSNFGECMVLQNCMVEGAVNLGSGEWHAYGCSFDNALITADTGARVYLHGGHLENPGAATSARFGVAQNYGLLYLQGVEFVINRPVDGDYNRSPLYSDSSNNGGNGGIILDGCMMPESGYITPEVTDTIRVFVAGSGRAFAKNSNVPHNWNGWAVSSACNLAYNGDVETGNINGWELSGTAADTVVTADGSVKKSGTYSLKINPGVWTNKVVAQSAAIRGGENVSFIADISVAVLTANASNYVSSQVVFLSSNGTQTGSIGYQTWTAATSGWVAIRSAGVAPAGTVKAQVQIYVQNGSAAGPTTVYVDNLVLTSA